LELELALELDWICGRWLWWRGRL